MNQNQQFENIGTKKGVNQTVRANNHINHGFGKISYS